MSLILDRCPFYEEATEVETPTGPILIRSYQIVAWVGLSVRGMLSRPFPAVLDTGHSHNFSIKEEHLGVVDGTACSRNPDDRACAGEQATRRTQGCRGRVYPNTPGKRDALRGKPPYRLILPEGIAVHRASDPFAPRLPLLGIRALVTNQLRITIDGSRKEVSLERN